MWSGNLTDYSNLRIFGCSAYTHVKIDKLELRAVKFILMIRYSSRVKGYSLWCTDQDSPTFMTTKDVTFHEENLVNASKQVKRTNTGSNSRTIEVDSNVHDENKNARDSFRIIEDSQTVQSIQQTDPRE